MNNLFISEVIATRLSHDLIGNIGAVSNAVELLNEGDEIWWFYTLVFGQDVPQ